MTLSPEHKKYIWAVGILVVIILLVIGANEWNARAQAEAEAAAHPCVINFLTLFLQNVSSTTPKATIARTLLTQYLNAYEHTPNCPADGIKDYTITSIGSSQDVAAGFRTKVGFDILPASTTATVWATAETHWDGSWIRGKQATLGIQDIHLTPTAATSTFRLII